MSAPILHKQDAIDAIYEHYLASPTTPAPHLPPSPPNATTPPHRDVLARMFQSKHGAEIRALWEGDTSSYGSASEADLALVSHLGWWTNYDATNTDTLFRQSRLYRPKWDELRGKHTYRSLTVAKAFEGKAPGDGFIPTGTAPVTATNSGSGVGPKANQEPEEPWAPLKKLPSLHPPVPALPADMLPEPLRAWLTDVAERTALPLEFVACPAVVALSAVVGRGLGIHPKRRDDWLVVPNLWGGIVGRPGLMKSAAISEATRPLSRLAADAHERYLVERNEAEATQERIALEMAAAKESAKRAAKKGETGELNNLEGRLVELKGKMQAATVTEKRYLTQDPTTEKLGELLNQNPRGLLLLRDELAGWLRILERPGREGDREFYLEAWNGNQGYTFDRIGRGTIHIEALTLALFGGIQPGKLKRYLAEALEGDAGADGLLQRFQLVVYPDHAGPWRNVDRYPNAEAKNRAYQVFEALDQLSPDAIGAEPTENGISALRFSPEAQALFDAWRDQLEHRLRSEELRHKPAFEAQLSKYRSLMPSLALLFHLVDLVDGNASGPVSLEAAKLGAGWCAYLEVHAAKLYALEISTHIKAAHDLALKITEGAVRDGQTVRNIYNASWEGLSDRKTVMGGLEVLAENNWVRTEERSTGGRPSSVIRLHPDLREDAQ